VPRSVPFHFVDVFADRPLTGNPVAVVSDAEILTETEMREIAREFNQSETTFILPATRAGATWRLRSFTPIGAEVGGAGHNALGAWLWLADSGRLPDDMPMAQQIGDDVLPVEVERGVGRRTSVSLDQTAPVFGAVLGDDAQLVAALGLTLGDRESDRPAQVVSTGAGHLLVPLRDRAAVDRAAPNAPRLLAVLREIGGEGCYLYSGEAVAGSDAAAYARFFNPTVGIWEDPATGTAAGPLVASLVAAGRIAPRTPAIVEQGHAVGRPSRITVVVDDERVRVSGTGLIAASGTLHL
jgi:trans-2,3-dihydro-3-hydroxyanthranilate isomerase